MQCPFPIQGRCNVASQAMGQFYGVLRPFCDRIILPVSAFLPRTVSAMPNAELPNDQNIFKTTPFHSILRALPSASRQPDCRATVIGSVSFLQWNDTNLSFCTEKVNGLYQIISADFRLFQAPDWKGCIVQMIVSSRIVM
jgi:hypothetical protein